MEFYNNFMEIHGLLKKYNCGATYDFEEEYRESIVEGGYNFYKPEKEMHDPTYKKKYDEKVYAILDVCIPTKWSEAPKGEIRFDIRYSSRASLHRMYISLPTLGKSKSLSLKIYETQGDVITDIEKYLKISKAEKTKINKRISDDKEQIDLFNLVN